MAGRGGGKSVISAMLGIVIAAVITGSIIIPITQETVSQVSGTTATILGLIPLFFGLLIIGCAYSFMKYHMN